jgi:signal transduction histidine kinase
MVTGKQSTIRGKSGSGTLSARHRSAWWWLISKPFDLVSSLLYIGVLVPYLYAYIRRFGYTPPVSWWQATLMLAITFVLLALDRLEYFCYGEKTPGSAAVALLLTRIGCIEIISWLDQFKYSPFLYVLIPFLAFLYFGELVGYSLAALAWLVYIVKQQYYSPGWLSNGDELHSLVLFTVGIVLVVTITRVVTKEQASRTRAEELLAELEVSHRQLKEYAEQAEELATTRERNRLARDIHDTLGHYLTIINVQLEKALAFHDQRPQEAIQAVNDAKRLAREALQDVRRSVSTLRATRELPEFTSSLSQLVERMQSEKYALELRQVGSDESFSKQRLLVLYRVVQEGLTNVQKHARANHIWIDLQFGDQEATLTLRDNGQGFDATDWQMAEPERDRGYGLQGLQERLELIGGSLRITSVPAQGTILCATIAKDSSLLNADRKMK